MGEKKNYKKNLGHLFDFNHDAQHVNTKSSRKTHHPQLASKLYDVIVSSLKQYNVDVSTLDKNIVNVDKGGTYGLVTCVLCPIDIDENKREKRVYYSHSKSRAPYWVISNFKKHLKNIKHKMQKSPLNRNHS